MPRVPVTLRLGEGSRSRKRGYFGGLRTSSTQRLHRLCHAEARRSISRGHTPRCFGRPQHDAHKFFRLPIPPRGMRGLSMTHARAHQSTNLPIYPFPNQSGEPSQTRRFMISGRAPLVELRPPACRTSQLRPGCPVAPTGNRLWLLPSGPDQVHRSAPHRTQPSALLSPAVPATVEPSEWEFSPAIADCEYRAPLAPRLARPGALYIRWGGVASCRLQVAYEPPVTPLFPSFPSSTCLLIYLSTPVPPESKSRRSARRLPDNWRRGRDLNPRSPEGYALSRRAH